MIRNTKKYGKCEICGKRAKNQWKIPEIEKKLKNGKEIVIVKKVFKHFCREGHFKKYQSDALEKIENFFKRERKKKENQKMENWKKWIERRKKDNLPYEEFEERFSRRKK